MTEESQVPGRNENERPESMGEQEAAAQQPQAASPEQALLEAEQKAERCLTNWKRAEADLVNYRRRVEQERIEAAKYGNATLLKKFLPVLDDIERAISNAPAEVASTPWFDGLRLAHRKFLNVLESEGVATIENAGEPFDPRYEEAILHEPGPEGIVTAVFQKGYRYDDRVLRPALVKVGSGEPTSDHPSDDGPAQSQ